MSDEIIREVWRVKDTMARKHNYDVKALGAELMRMQVQRRRGTARKAGPRKPASAPSRRARP